MRLLSTTVILLFCVMFFACSNKEQEKIRIVLPEQDSVNKEQKEIDEIYSLLICSIVYDDWQGIDTPRDKRRGYNVGSLIVNENNEPVYSSLNSINSTNNTTQHGEVRAITGYLNDSSMYNLKGHTIYTTLEPCVMCAGLIIMSSTQRVVYMQNDIDYSKAFERLAINTKECGGYPPYPRALTPVALHTEIADKLNAAYLHFYKNEKENMIARFLSTDEAKQIFKEAKDKFLSYQPKLGSNKQVYKSARHFYEECVDTK